MRKNKKDDIIKPKKINERKKDLEKIEQMRFKFWTNLLEKSNKKTILFKRIEPNRANAIKIEAGKPGLYYRYVIGPKYGRAEFFIDTDDWKTNNEIYSRLLKKKREIESEFGGKLRWEMPENVRGCYITKHFLNIGLLDEDKWDELQDKMVDAMIKLEKALYKHITRLNAD